MQFIVDFINLKFEQRFLLFKHEHVYFEISLCVAKINLCKNDFFYIHMR